MLVVDEGYVFEDAYDVGEVGYFWERCHPESFHEAQERFVREVDPYAMHLMMPCESDIQLVQMMFTEWLVFDYVAPDGHNPLYHYMDACNGAGRCLAADQLKQVEHSQFFSQFWVIAQDEEHGTALLADSKSKQLFHLHNGLVARNENWEDGLLGLRIAHIDGEWRMVGGIPLHDRGLRKDEHVCVTEMSQCRFEGPDAKKNCAQSYLSCARDLIGARGRYRGTVEVVAYPESEAACSTGLP
ncbi:hypothetical protein [Atopobium sp. oral taxon 810]|uniref:hypothetical protein n=1 Tax=Atopobium sp. oral taxon 810 TaxID=712158 RepID=UPI000397FE9F|nr:hypothetical protein [Atopobium sp. oral taxon 810]ERI06217.1 hypothetical protein HMPREF9069_00329 [Atopobium sp. oral taxon 810 str. F0209]